MANLLSLISLSLFFFLVSSQSLPPFAPPAVPLIVNDPYFSVFSPFDNLYDGNTANGPNGEDNVLGGIVRVDGTAYRFMSAYSNGASYYNVSFDLSGNDLPGSPFILPEQNFTLCSMACDADPQCFAWAYCPGGSSCPFSGNTSVLCWLKSSASTPTPNSCRVSGVKGVAQFPVEQTAQQISVQVFPLRTVYQFSVAQGRVGLNLTFTTPVLPQNIEVLARPVSYVTFEVASLDGGAHEVQVYFDASSQLATNDPQQNVSWSRSQTNNLTVVSLGNTQNDVPIPCATPNAESSCPDRIYWGYLSLAGPQPTLPTQTLFTSIQAALNARTYFAQTGSLPSQDDPSPSLNVGAALPVLAFALDFATVSDTVQTYTFMAAYNDLASLQWFGVNYLAYWNRLNGTVEDMLQEAYEQWDELQTTCAEFDEQQVASFMNVGGPEFAAILSLAYRQAYGSTKLVWNHQDATMWQMLKEISTGSCLSTMDVIYPACPLYLYYNPDLLYTMLVPILEYANNRTPVAYNLVWTPHHLGGYPVGYITPDEQEQMPVEETANMILMLTAIAQQKGGDVTYLDEDYWPLLEGWAEYLVSTAYDPGYQLCTDDFMGPSAHNANLALKGIIALGAYAKLMTYKGENETAAYYWAVALNYTNYWMEHADDGNHYRLEYDLANTWSQKYNLVWQKILGLDLYPVSVFEEEEAYYISQMLEYGVQLDLRKQLTKTDWFMWTGAMGSEPYFDTVVEKVFAQLNSSSNPNRFPLTDLYDTVTSLGGFNGGNNFRCRAVVGAFWAKLLVLQQEEGKAI